MIEQELTLAMPDGETQAFLYRPDDAKDYPGILSLTDIWGIRPANQGMARRLAAQGYAVLLPNVFYRYGKIPLIDFDPKPGEERTMKAMHALFASLSAQQMGADGAIYADFLLAQKNVRGPKIGVVGHCFTGAMALRIAAQIPERIAAMASFHGGKLVTEEADSPHLLLPKIAARLYFGHAVEDVSMPVENIAMLEAALKSWGERHNVEESHAGGKVSARQYESETYQGALHGWTVPGRPVYNQAQAEAAFDKLTALMRETLR